MTPAVLDSKTYLRGDTIPPLRFTYRTGVAPDLTPIDLTGVNIRSTFQSLKDSVTKVVGDGITIIDASAGIFEIDAHILPKSGIYNFDIETEFPDGTVKTYIKGSYFVGDDITK